MDNFENPTETEENIRDLLALNTERINYLRDFDYMPRLNTEYFESPRVNIKKLAHNRGRVYGIIDTLYAVNYKSSSASIKQSLFVIDKNANDEFIFTNFIDDSLPSTLTCFVNYSLKVVYRASITNLNLNDQIILDYLENPNLAVLDEQTELSFRKGYHRGALETIKYLNIKNAAKLIQELNANLYED